MTRRPGLPLRRLLLFARLGNDHGIELLRAAIDNPQIPFLRMEAVLALSELHG